MSHTCPMCGRNAKEVALEPSLAWIRLLLRLIQEAPAVAAKLAEEDEACAYALKAIRRDVWDDRLEA